MAVFSRNVGGIDRAIRLIAGIVLLPLGLFLWSQGYWLAPGVALVGTLALFTGLVRFCILYVPFSFSTVPARQAPADRDAAHRAASAGPCCPGASRVSASR
jgi:hypothetical protein